MIRGWREEKGKARRERMRGGCWSRRGRRLGVGGSGGFFFTHATESRRETEKEMETERIVSLH